MPQYLCFHRRKREGENPKPQANQTKPSPAEMQAMYQAFEAWRKRFADNLVDLGGQLKPATKLVSVDGIEDGPLAETKEIIGGYMLIEADSLDTAAEIVRAMPGLSPGAHIEVREVTRPGS